MSINATAGVVLEWCFVSISFLFVISRLYVRCWLQSRFSASDLFIVASFALLTTSTAFDHILLVRGIWASNLSTSPLPGISQAQTIVPDTKDLRYVFRIIFSTTPVFYSSLWCIKAALVAFYYQLIPAVMIWLRRALHFLTFYIATSWLVVICLNTFWCLPPRRNWSIDVNEACWSTKDPRVYYPTMALHLSSSLGLYILPSFIFNALQLSKRKQLGFFAMMGLGTICIICIVGRAISVRTSQAMPPVGVWRSAETSMAITVACSPSLKWLAKSFRSYYSAKREAEGEREECCTYSWSRKTGIGSGNWIQELEDSDKEDEGTEALQMTAFFEQRNVEAGEGPSGMPSGVIRVQQDLEQNSQYEEESKLEDK